MSESPLRFVALGGAGEIGMNLALYGMGEQWFMVDCGVTFADLTHPGIDLITPDPSFIEARRDKYLGLIATHAHEDHIGAIPHLWQRFGGPVYATDFTANVLRRKLAEVGLQGAVPIKPLVPGTPITLGPFTITAISITHSIPEANALAIETAHGTVLHSGDWKLDPDPLVGPSTDTDALRRIGDNGALALICDSTNVFSPGVSGSEAAVRQSLRELLRGREGRIVATTFASNVARVETLAVLAAELGREAVLVGRSLWRITQAARESGYLSDIRPFLDPKDAGYIPRDKLFLICTGCQGEPRGAMARIASGDHPDVRLSPRDMVVFSSKIIPGNERTLFRLHNMLAQTGIEVVTEKDHFVHVSGHPSRDELTEMYRWVRPRIAIPVHGEARHIIEHTKLARDMQVPEVLSISNGDLVHLAPGPAHIVDRVPVGRLAVDAGGLVPLEGGALQERRRLMFQGAAHISLLLSDRGRLIAPPGISMIGVVDDQDGETADDILEAVTKAVGRLPAALARDDENIEEAARVALRRIVKAETGRKPLTSVHIIRADGAGRRADYHHQEDEDVK